ncbi:CDP-glycerol glycerophosphotransferase family protein [Virgibacillus ndiopensis]|uniref:CDP-glycerol glycerophosphotransferase family protein n=1 Tax=Virgibacillus ndiopensis TaxID=2004408 RepID=UPI000C069111|nr:CDP-glycerol glycerophosphotransferase family protein [Virgibacillus ndiopensis]
MNHLQTLKKVYIVFYKVVLNFVYTTFSILLKQDNKKVVIALYRTDKLEGNLKFIHDQLIKQLPDAKIHLVYGQNKMNLKLFKEVFLIANARYLILDDYYLPIYLIKPSSNLKVIQLWHAAGAFKKFGYSTIGTKFGPSLDYLKLVPIHSNYTHVYISSEKFMPFYAEAFNMSFNSIFSLGVPRIDLFTNKEICELVKNQLYVDYPMLLKEGFVNILVAPTYKAEGIYAESSLDVIDSVLKITQLMNKDKRIIFKAHPYMNEVDINRLKACPNVLVVQGHSINEIMLVSDAFITDYSSAVFEFALLKKPLAHFIPDIEEYNFNRGFYQDIETISDGEILHKDSQLLDWINERIHNEFFNTTRMIKYNFDNTENVSKKIVEHFTS